MSKHKRPGKGKGEGVWRMETKLPDEHVADKGIMITTQLDIEGNEHITIDLAGLGSLSAWMGMLELSKLKLTQMSVTW